MAVASRVPKAAFLPANIDACALYRMFLPHLHIPESMFRFRSDRLNIAELEEYEVVVVQRQVTEANLKAMQLMKRAGKRLIYDLDDNMWNLPASNPAAKVFKMMQEGFAICAKEAHVLTVSTQSLKSAVRTAIPGLKAEILITPNGVDFDLFRPSMLERDDDKVILGWGGSNTHSADIAEVWALLPDLLKRHENLYMEFIGMNPPPEIVGHERVTHRTWVPVGEWASRFSSWSWDISMAPLEDNRFNRAKSCIKGLEAAAVGIPCLMSNVTPYHELCALGDPELMWLLCDTKYQWKAKLEELVTNAPLRKKMADLLLKPSKQHFDMERTKNNWMYAMQHSMGWC